MLANFEFLEKATPKIARTVISSDCQYMNERRELSGEKNPDDWKLFFPPSMVSCSVCGPLLCSYCTGVPVLLQQLWKSLNRDFHKCRSGVILEDLEDCLSSFEFSQGLGGIKAMQYAHSHSVSQNSGLAEQRRQSVQNQRLLFNQSTESFSHVTLKCLQVWSS